MFCPNCGTSDQSVETYCRSCGFFIPDFEAAKKNETSPQKHIQVNSFFSMTTAVVSLSLAVALLGTMIGREGTPVIVYLVFAFLICITGWNIQTFIRTRKLKEQFEKLRPNRERQLFETRRAATNLLDEANFEGVVPASVTERTTRNLSASEKKRSA